VVAEHEGDSSFSTVLRMRTKESPHRRENVCDRRVLALLWEIEVAGANAGSEF